MSAPFVGPPPHRSAPSLLSLADLPFAALDRLVTRSVEPYRDPDVVATGPLRGRSVGVLFTKTSTRTRTAFTVAAGRLGAQVVSYGPDDLQLGTGESLADTGRMFGLMLDGLVVRTAGPLADMRLLAASSGIPVVNAMAAEEHPTQAVCDLATIVLHRGGVAGVRLLYVGEANNTATALALGAAAFPGVDLTFLTPPGYALPAAVLDRAAECAAAGGGRLTECHDPAEARRGVDFVYTTRWQTTGTSKADPAWRETFRPFYVDQAFLERSPGALFLHDLPAHRGDEVAGAVLDGPRSIAWSQARMKLYSAMAVLESLLGAVEDRAASDGGSGRRLGQAGLATPTGSAQQPGPDQGQ
ncbi:ornithine carbamoyltransferase [Plantactinospora sp. BC1]|uniref:ornithine carbamoyltransferase n=1 Tax=Plantactinospora sp. BC1 TaxID=2108470 RepID=UPI000D155E4E|nr:ornithine carbamoyltransferase [Plantactinospora sp. BC1]AVT28833.1 ornithine carbamoyltransferase [Plantactinospora sp. BC1]